MANSSESLHAVGDTALTTPIDSGVQIIDATIRYLDAGIRRETGENSAKIDKAISLLEALMVSGIPSSYNPLESASFFHSEIATTRGSKAEGNLAGVFMRIDQQPGINPNLVTLTSIMMSEALEDPAASIFQPGVEWALQEHVSSQGVVKISSFLALLANRTLEIVEAQFNILTFRDDGTDRVIESISPNPYL